MLNNSRNRPRTATLSAFTINPQMSPGAPSNSPPISNLAEDEKGYAIAIGLNPGYNYSAATNAMSPTAAISAHSAATLLATVIDGFEISTHDGVGEAVDIPLSTLNPTTSIAANLDALYHQTTSEPATRTQINLDPNFEGSANVVDYDFPTSNASQPITTGGVGALIATTAWPSINNTGGANGATTMVAVGSHDAKVSAEGPSLVVERTDRVLILAQGKPSAAKEAQLAPKESERKKKEDNHPTSTNDGPTSTDIEGFSVSDVHKRCIVTGVGPGTIRFVGLHAENNETKIGVELNKEKGKNNGTVKGHVYFQCNPGYGLLTKPSKVRITSKPDDENGKLEAFC
jgi:hypothetical protein